MHDWGLCWSEKRLKCFTGIGHFRCLNFAILRQSLTTTKKSHFNLIVQLTCKTAFSLIRVLFPVPHVCEHEVHSFHSSHRQSMGQRLTKQSFVSRSFFWHFWLPRWPRNRVRTPANWKSYHQELCLKTLFDFGILWREKILNWPTTITIHNKLYLLKYSLPKFQNS